MNLFFENILEKWETFSNSNVLVTDKKYKYYTKLGKHFLAMFIDWKKRNKIKNQIKHRGRY